MIYCLMLQLPLADTLPPSAVHKPGSDVFYVHVQGQAQGYPGFQWLKKDSSFSPPRPCPPRSTSCSVILQKGKLRPKGMPEWLSCSESVSRHFSYYALLSAFSAASTVLGTQSLPEYNINKHRYLLNIYDESHLQCTQGIPRWGSRHSSCLWGPIKGETRDQ